jgi:hypothetical protein
MPALHNACSTFAKRVDEGEKVVSSVEALWQTAPMRSAIRRQIGDAQLCALYEMAYLLIFGHRENFIEECVMRMLVGQGSQSYTPVIATPPKAVSLGAARKRVLGGRPFVLWHDAGRSAIRVADHVSGSPLEALLLGEQTALERYAAIRHAIAHQSDDARRAFQAASTSLTGVAHPTPGSLLRTQDHSDPLNPVRWIRNITSELRRFAVAVTS